ncbi:uncharacterized protein LOC131597823 [Vicia villosa]|uniref:uncharacterized protein LOC131597823 n=1 Tax=Vicia villosa TaxID=3911 RepID=UPI00273BE02A|nr:uncharacterized protein LOC131597823 [Vicia villosa]
MVQCYCCNRFGHFAKDCWSNKEEAKIARGDSDDEPVLLMAYESDEEPVNSEEESESEVSEDESELEDDSEAEDKSESEGDSESEGESEDESESEEDSASDDESELESGTSEGGASEGSPASDGGHDSERKDYEVGTSEGRASEGDPTSKGGTSGGNQTSEENPEGDMVLESEGDSELLGIEEALKKKGWLNAIKEELEALEGNKTWKLTKLPKEKKTINVRWVFKEKSAFLNGVSEVAHCSNQKKLADVMMKDVKTEHLIRLRDGVGVVDFG